MESVDLAMPLQPSMRCPSCATALTVSLSRASTHAAHSFSSAMISHIKLQQGTDQAVLTKVIVWAPWWKPRPRYDVGNVCLQLVGVGLVLPELAYIKVRDAGLLNSIRDRD